MKSDKLIKTLMNSYRNSRFHNAKNGKRLANLLSFYNKLFGKKIVIKEINNIVYELDLSQVIDSSLFYSGTFEPKNESIMNRFIKPGMCVIDIGANIGYHTFRMAKQVSPGGFVYAIEPTNWAIKKIQRNKSLNPHIENIMVDQIALSDDSIGMEKVQFQSSYRLDNLDLLETEEVMIMKLDDYVREKKIQAIDFIKLDVDGFEGKIIAGARETIGKYRPIILFELTPGEVIKTGKSPLDMIKFLQDTGYSLYNDELQLLNETIIQSILQNPSQSCMIFAVQGTI